MVFRTLMEFTPDDFSFLGEIGHFLAKGKVWSLGRELEERNKDLKQLLGGKG